ncbi:hypothetical protein Tco_1345503 [Tanacetum coccineum]
MVYQLTKFHVQRVDMVINPPWNLPFLGAKGLTSPEQTATGKGISNPLMAVMVCQKPYVAPWLHLLVARTSTLEFKIENDLKNSIYNILRKFKEFKVKIKNVLKKLEVHKEKKDIMQINAQKQTTGPQESTLRDKLASVHFKISTLETTPKDIQIATSYMKDLLKPTS